MDDLTARMVARLRTQKPTGPLMVDAAAELERLAARCDNRGERLADVVKANDDVNAQCMKEAVRADNAEARLAEAERVIAEYATHSQGCPVIFDDSLCTCGLTKARAAVSADDVINAQHDETGRTWRGPRSQLPRRYFEVEAICCLDYPRCDCNSPPEPDNRTLWREIRLKRHLHLESVDEIVRLRGLLTRIHGIAAEPRPVNMAVRLENIACIASWERDETYAQLAEEQRFIHGAAAVTGLTQQDYDALVRDAMLWRTRSPTGAGGNARAFVCCEGVGQHAPGCIAQEAARCNCDLPMPVNSVDGDGLAWCITCGFNIGTTP